MAKSARGTPRATSSHSAPYCPDEGDIISIDFDPQSGSEQKGRRPALVLSSKRYNTVAKLCIVCPITNRIKGYPFEVAIPENEDGMTGVVLSDQIKSLSWEKRGSRYLSASSDRVLLLTKAKVKALLLIS